MKTSAMCPYPIFLEYTPDFHFILNGLIGHRKNIAEKKKR